MKAFRIVACVFGLLLIHAQDALAACGAYPAGVTDDTRVLSIVLNGNNVLDSMKPYAVGVSANGLAGQMTYDSTNNALVLCNGSAWVSIATGSGGTPGGANTQVQFNNSGAFGGDSNFVWDNTNKRLGIGTTPADKLDVQGRIRGGVASKALIQDDGTNAVYTSTMSTAGISLVVDQGATKGLFIDTTGNVGIGTTAPSTKLNVTDANGMMFYDGSSAASNNLALSNLTPTNGRQFSLRNVVSGGLGRFDIRDDTSGAERISITSTGNVGIANVAASAKLSVGANASLASLSSISTDFLVHAGTLGAALNDEVSVGSFAVAHAGGNHSALGIRAMRTAAGNTWTTSAFGIGMDVDNSVRAGASLWLHANGNVGIGTTSPSAVVHAYGGAWNTTLRGESASGAGTGLTLKNNDTGGHEWGIISNGSGNAGGAGALQFWDNTASKTAMVMTGAGNVGIGTASPTGKLTIVDNTATYYPHLLLTNSAGGGRSYGINVGVASVANGYFQIYDHTAGASRLVITDSGNVGIGITAPASKLHVDGDVLLSATLPKIASASYLTLQSGAGQAMTFNTGGASERVRIDANGNVGIGTTPLYRFHAVGGAAADWTARIDNSNNAAQVYMAHGSGYGMYISPGSNAGAGTYALQVMTAGGGSTSLYVRGDGNVGINTSNPGYKLHVQGVVALAGLTNTNTGAVLCYNTTTGELQASAGTSCANTSDERVKRNIQPLADRQGLAALMRLRPVTFEFKDISTTAPGTQLGFVAQEVQKVYPSIVTKAGTTTIQNGDGSTTSVSDTLGIHYEGFIPPLVKSVQELKADNDNLRADNDNQTTAIEELREEIKALKAAIH